MSASVNGGGHLASTQTITMAELEKRRADGSGRVLDVRGAAEFEAGRVPGALNIPHTRVSEQLGALPAGLPLLVHCNSGARSAAAVSLLERYGFQAFQVNDPYANYQPAAQQAGVTA